MDLGLSEEQEMVRASARDFLTRECPPSLVRQMEDDVAGYTPTLWGKMAEVGWLGLPFPEEFGGSGNSFLDLCILLEEHGRSLLPSPYFPTIVLGGLAILHFGSMAQKREHLPAIIGGKRILAYAQTEPEGTWDAAGIGLEATPDGDFYVLNGTKLFVPYAGVAGLLLVPARTGGSGEAGVTVFVVEAKAAGIACRPIKTIGRDHQYEIEFKSVRVPRGSILGGEHEGWSVVKRINEWGAAGKCAEMVGMAERALEMTVEYAKERVQFDRPIGSFQIIQHYCAQMATDVDGSRYLTYEAVWRLSEGLDAGRQVSMAKAWVSEACRRVCALGHQVHGAIGFTKEHDLQLYFRRAKMAELSFGDADYHRELVAQALNGAMRE